MTSAAPAGGRPGRTDSAARHRVPLPSPCCRSQGPAPEEDTVDSTATVEPTTAQDDADAPVVEQDLLVEDVSIDGMCGVY